MTAAEDRLYYSVASHREVNADITIIGGIIVNQVSPGQHYSCDITDADVIEVLELYINSL